MATWRDRQREAAITTPDGTRFTFLFEDLERSRSENASIFKFAERSGALVQRLSSGQDIYPLTIIFTGADYDLIAESFWQKTKQPGVFILEHPRFPGFKRVQLLNIRVRIAAKTGDNQAAFDAVFHETINFTLPETALDSTTQILQTSNALNESAATAFADNAELGDELIVPALEQKSRSIVDNIYSVFSSTAAKESALNTAFNAQYLTVQENINNITGGPLEFARSLAIFISTPSRVATSIDDRIGSYIKLFDNTESSLVSAAADVLEAAKNKAALALISGLINISGMCQASVSDADYLTRADIISVADEIIDVSDRAIVLLDEYSDRFNDELDPAARRFEITDTINILNDLTSLTIARLFDIAFTLKQERFITLDAERDPVTLTHELYGFSDDNLDFLIATNSLKGDELFLIPKGKEIVYYI